MYVCFVHRFRLCNKRNFTHLGWDRREGGVLSQLSCIFQFDLIKVVTVVNLTDHRVLWVTITQHTRCAHKQNETFYFQHCYFDEQNYSTKFKIQTQTSLVKIFCFFCGCEQVYLPVWSIWIQITSRLFPLKKQRWDSLPQVLRRVLFWICRQTSDLSNFIIF